MEKVEKIICINIGSRTKKFSLFDIAGNEIKTFNSPLHYQLDISDFVIDLDIKTLAFSFRIVASGKLFKTDHVIDSEYIHALEEASSLSPLHVLPLLQEIKNIKGRYDSVKMYAISDSTFHSTMSVVARNYALSEEIREKYGIEKQGFHGLSISYSLERLKGLLGNLPNKVMLCHMGGGTSVTAIKDGNSVDTSMGWTPLDGVLMAERVGNIDPGVIAFLSQKSDVLGHNDIEEYLYNSCGIAAVSGIEHGDMKNVIEARNKGDYRANLAFNMYIYSVRKYIGQMYMALSGCDAIVLSGAIAENSSILRTALLDDLGFMGFDLDIEKNMRAGEIVDTAYIDKNGSKPIVIIKTNENLEMFRKTLDILQG